MRRSSVNLLPCLRSPVSPSSPPPLVSGLQPRFTLPTPVRGLAWNPAAAPQVEVSTVSELLAATTAAVEGETAVTIVLKAGTYDANLVIAANSMLPADGFVTFAAENYQTFTPGKRAKRSEVIVEIKGVTSAPTIEVLPGAKQVRFIGIELTSSAASLSNCVVVGRSTGVTSLGLIPRDVHFSHCYVHGEPTQGMRTGIHANADHFSFRDGIAVEFHQENNESHAFEGFHCNGPQLWENNEVSAYSIFCLFGAGPDEFEIEDLQMSDVTLRNNWMHRPLAWQSSTPWDTIPPSGFPNAAVTDFNMKNCIESKGVVRFLIENNFVERCWIGGQPGIGLNLKSTNQYSQSPWIVTQDVTVRHNIFSEIWTAAQIAGTGSTAAPLDNRTNRIHIYDNAFGVGTIGSSAAFQITDGTNDAEGGRFLKMAGRPEHVAVENNTHFSNDKFLMSMTGDDLDGSTPRLDNFTYRNNVGSVGLYGIKADGQASGQASVDHAIHNPDIRGNVFVGDPSLDTPNEFVENVAAIGYSDVANHDYRLPAGSDFAGKGCNGVTLNAMRAAVLAGDVF